MTTTNNPPQNKTPLRKPTPLTKPSRLNDDEVKDAHVDNFMPHSGNQHPKTKLQKPARKTALTRPAKPVDRAIQEGSAEDQGYVSKRRTTNPTPAHRNEPARHNPTGLHLEYVDDDVIVEQNYKAPVQIERQTVEAPIAKGKGRRSWNLGARQKIKVGKYHIPVVSSIISILFIAAVIFGAYYFANSMRTASNAPNNNTKQEPAQENVKIMEIVSPYETVHLQF